MTDQPTDLPPLPKPVTNMLAGDDWEDVFTADQMHAYLIADRAARALTQGDLSEVQWYDIASAHATGEWNGDGYLDSIKAVGRAAIGAAAPSALVASPVETEYAKIGLLEWAVERWRSSVQKRPLVNIHRRTMDDCWRSVMRYAGGDPDTLVGPSHDELIEANPPTKTAQQTTGIEAKAKALIAALDQPFRYPGELKTARDELALALAAIPVAAKVQP